jgi:hypothetical protein
MLRGTPFQVLAQTTVFWVVFSLGNAITNWHRFIENPWSTIAPSAAGAYTVAAVIIAWRFVDTRYLDRK